MSAIYLDIPEETLISLKTDPESFGRDMKMLAAVKLFELGKLSPPAGRLDIGGSQALRVQGHRETIGNLFGRDEAKGERPMFFRV